MVSVMLGRGLRFLKRASVPVAGVGAGYAGCWAQGREETVPQYLACAVTASRVGIMGGLRRLGEHLPQDATWVREKLSRVEASQLRVLLGMVNELASRGLDSALLQHFALGQLCACTEADPRGLAVRGLAGDQGDSVQQGLAELVAQIDRTATALTATADARGEPALLRTLAAALRSIVVCGGTAWHRELGNLGVLHVANTAALALLWLAAALRPSDSPRKPAWPSAALTAEDQEQISEDLSVVWQALGQPDVANQLRSASTWHKSEALDLRRRYEARLAAVGAAVVPTKDATRPPLEVLAPRLRACVTSSMRAPAAAKSPGPPSAAASGLEKVNKSLEYAAWAVLVGATVVAMSEDGFGWFPFHAVPSQWRAGFHSLVQQRGVQVEELLAKYDPQLETESMSGSITLGPLGAQSTYIQAPSEFRPPS